MYLSTREAVPHAGFGYPSSSIIGSDIGVGSIDRYNVQDSYSFLNPYEGASHTHYNATQVYGLNALNVRTIIAGQIKKNQEESWYTKYALPRVNINNNKIQYSTIVFENALAELTPAEGVPRIISSQIHSTTKKLQRRAVGLLSEESYRNTENGSQMYLMSLQHLATIVNDTQNYDVVMAYFNCEKYDIQWERTNGYYNGKTMFDIFRRDVDSFASIQKFGFAKMDASVGSIHTRYIPDILDMWILPREVRNFLGVIPEEYRLYYKGGEQAVDQLKNGIGLLSDDVAPPLIFGNLYKVFFTRTFATGENQNSINPMMRRRIIGEYFPQTSETNQKGSDYKSIYRAIKVYDEDLDEFVIITLEDSLNAIKYMFNIEGDDRLKNVDDLVGATKFNIVNFDSDIKQHFLYKSYEHNTSNSKASIVDNYGLKPIDVIGEMKPEHFSTNSLIEMAKSVIRYTVNRLDCDTMCEELYNDFHAGIELVTKFRKMSITSWIQSLLQDFNESYSPLYSEPDKDRYMNTLSVSILPYDQTSGSSITKKIQTIMDASLLISSDLQKSLLSKIDEIQSNTKLTINELIPFLTNWSGLLFLSQVKMSPIIESFKSIKSTITKFVESIKKISSITSQILRECHLFDDKYTPSFYPIRSKEIVFLNSLNIFNNVYPLWTSRKMSTTFHVDDAGELDEGEDSAVNYAQFITYASDNRVRYLSNSIRMAKCIYAIYEKEYINRIHNNPTDEEKNKILTNVLHLVKLFMEIQTEKDNPLDKTVKEIGEKAKSTSDDEKSETFRFYVYKLRGEKFTLLVTNVFYQIVELTISLFESIVGNSRASVDNAVKFLDDYATKKLTIDPEKKIGALFDPLFKKFGADKYEPKYKILKDMSDDIEIIGSIDEDDRPSLTPISGKTFIDSLVGKKSNITPTRTTFSLHEEQLEEYIQFLNQNHYRKDEIPHITISLPTTHYNKPATFKEITEYYNSIKSTIQTNNNKTSSQSIFNYDNETIINERPTRERRLSPDTLLEDRTKKDDKKPFELLAASLFFAILDKEDKFIKNGVSALSEMLNLDIPKKNKLSRVSDRERGSEGSTISPSRSLDVPPEPESEIISTITKPDNSEIDEAYEDFTDRVTLAKRTAESLQDANARGVDKDVIVTLAKNLIKAVNEVNLRIKTLTKLQNKGGKLVPKQSNEMREQNENMTNYLNLAQKYINKSQESAPSPSSRPTPAEKRNKRENKKKLKREQKSKNAEKTESEDGNTSTKVANLVDYAKYEDRNKRVKAMFENYNKVKSGEDCDDMKDCDLLENYRTLFDFVCGMNMTSFGSNPTLEMNYNGMIRRPMTLLDNVISIAILLTPFTYKMLCNLVDKNIILPMSFLHMRPHMRYDTLAGIKARAGSDTGNTFINSDQNNTMDGVAVEVKTHLRHVSYESAALITNNRFVLVVYDMFCFKCCGGAGTKFYDLEDLQYYSSTRHQYPNDKSIIVAPIPYEEREFPNPIDAAGTFSYFSVQGTSSNSKSNALHYSTAALMNGIFNFREKTENQEIEFWNYHPQSDGLYTPSINPKNTIMFRGYYGYSDPRMGSNEMIMRAGTGHLKSYAGPGYKSKRNGGLADWVPPLFLSPDDQQELSD